MLALGFSARGNTSTIASSPHPISEALQRLVETGEVSYVAEAVEGYSVEELAALPDSILFDYYYLKAFIKGEEGFEKQKRNYLFAAKDLCEKSLGIHSPVYLELCWAIGDSYEADGDLLSAFEIYQAALIQSIGLYTMFDEDVEWQYKTIEAKVKEWYQDEALRRRMVSHREKLQPRDAGKDAVQNDMEFYAFLYKDEGVIRAVNAADSLKSLEKWAEAACIYLEVARPVVDNTVARATLQELAANCLVNDENFEDAERLLSDNLEMLQGHESAKAYRRTLSLLSVVYIGIHNYSKAKDYAWEAKYWYEQELDFSRGYILCLHRCANLERGNENYFLAMLLEDVALQELYRNRVIGLISGDPIYREAFLANLLSGASLHYNQFGFHEEAYSQLETAIEIAEHNNIDASTFYSNLVSLAFAEKEFERALWAAEKAYERSKSDIHKIEIGTGLCMSQYFAHKPISGDIVEESSQYLREFVNKTFAFTSMEERRNLWRDYTYHFPMLNFLAYTSGNKKLNGLIYNNSLDELKF